MSVLQFTPFASAVDAAFWQALATKKLNVLKLSEAPQDIHAYYTTGRPLVSDNEEQQTVAVPARFSVPAQGLDNDDTRQPFTFPVSGTLVNTNTFEDFKNIDKNELFQRVTIKIWEAIRTREALKCPSVLSEFLMLTFADLKKYKFYYWFAFPAMMPQQEPWLLKEPLQPIASDFSKDEIAALAEAYQEHRYPYFLIKRLKENIRIGAIDQFEHFFDADQEPVVGFADPSNHNSLPGWPLRNFLALLHECYGVRKLKVVCYRETPGQITSVEASRILVAELPSSSSYAQDQPKAVGWERNAQGKLSPRMADLGPIMDPLRLADTAVDLNLKLMRWRIMPDLDLDKVKNTKCLLLGAGTLGCYVARSLLGWGVRDITFVDNGQVSYSNPVRQPLYSFSDYGAPKAKKAAESLLQIQPTMNASGYDLSIPMPGHIASSDDRLRKDVDMLLELIQAHNAIFLLTDSRESRWLPTLLGAHANKIVINAALGFDSYLVMRHGSQNASLGCYFCNDVVAPTDSLKDRTLDQQCTVTRPGLAAIAGALAVELLVSLLQHKDGVNAAADTATTDHGGSILGLVPHQIRGFLGQFRNLLIVGQQYENCTACSKKVLEAYRNDPYEFIKKVLRDPAYLEQVSGIAQMKADSEALLNEIDWVGQDDDDLQ